MKQLLDRLKGLEQSVGGLVHQVSALKEEREKLTSENNRLSTELNQLRESKGGLSQDGQESEDKLTIRKRDINIDHLKKELDRCIDEIETCLRQL